MSDRQIALLVLLGLLFVGIGVGLAWHSASFKASPAANPAPAVTSPAYGQCHSINGLPDPICTPGLADPRVTQDTIALAKGVLSRASRLKPRGCRAAWPLSRLARFEMAHRSETCR